MEIRQSYDHLYLHNGTSCTGKMISLYWIRALLIIIVSPTMTTKWLDLPYCVYVYSHITDQYQHIETKFLVLLTHLPLNKMAAISQTTFSNAFSWIKSFVFWFKFHWSLFLMVELTIFRHWFRLWLGADQATSHYLNQCWPSSLTHICDTRNL